MLIKLGDPGFTHAVTYFRLPTVIINIFYYKMCFIYCNLFLLQGTQCSLLKIPRLFLFFRVIYKTECLNCSCTIVLYVLDFILFYGVKIYGNRFGLQLICPYQVRLELIPTNIFAVWIHFGHKPCKGILVPHFMVNCQIKHPHSLFQTERAKP